MKYDFTAIEQKWQKIWQEKNLYASETGSAKEKFYALIEFPYPSGVGLHVGHARPYTAMDIVSRKRRLHPASRFLQFRSKPDFRSADELLLQSAHNVNYGNSFLLRHFA